ncbi:hypothetical protein BDV25DRAFT_52142 [Aspergillus avenaceus]|uniref:Uncharacterized protein n=1 Tax=Aspergillus avenaceus TaxID=36643 RepID=A0A5N6TJ30_ASPAV|nr:hypothetical protein BDV25DRAFT_52142 [Aspergillus avenaceus]
MLYKNQMLRVEETPKARIPQFNLTCKVHRNICNDDEYAHCEDIMYMPVQICFYLLCFYTIVKEKSRKEMVDRR